MPRRNAVRWFVVSLFYSVTACQLAHWNAVAAEERTISILLIGDSTVASYDKPPADRPGLAGWGQVFGEFFNDKVKILNRARSGRSSKSFVAEGLWGKAIAEKPDYIFIQFGHNDGPGKGERQTDPQGDYQDFLKKYIDETRASGGKPVLVTPVARRTYFDGQLSDKLQPYADAMKKVGKEKNVPVVDLHQKSMDLFKKLGDAGSADISPSTADRTHFSRKGATVMAKIVAESLPDAVPDLKPYLRRE